MNIDDNTMFSLENPIIERSPPNAVVYDLSATDRATIILPAGSTWTSGLHWHEHHTEYLRVRKGCISVTLGSQTRTITAADTEIRIDPYVWHSWQRSNISIDEDKQDVVVEERTEPEDSEKAVFFWNLNGVLLHERVACPPYMWKRAHGWLVDAWVLLHLLALFHALDNVPVFINILEAFAKRGFVFPEGTLGHVWLSSVDRGISRVVLFVGVWFAWALGIRPVNAARTPEEVLTRWQERRRGKRVKSS